MGRHLRPGRGGRTRPCPAADRRRAGRRQARARRGRTPGRTSRPAASPSSTGPTTSRHGSGAARREPDRGLDPHPQAPGAARSLGRRRDGHAAGRSGRGRVRAVGRRDDERRCRDARSAAPPVRGGSDRAASPAPHRRSPRARARTPEAPRPARQVECSPDVMRVLARNAWPGNVAEMEHVLRTALTNQPMGTIRREDLPASCFATSLRPGAAGAGQAHGQQAAQVQRGRGGATRDRCAVPRNRRRRR